MYYGFIFPLAEQYKEIPDELTIIYLFPEKTKWKEYRNDMKY